MNLFYLLAGMNCGLALLVMGQAVLLHRAEKNNERAKIDRRTARGDDAPGRLLPEARQLLADLDADAVAAKPVIENLNTATAALAAVATKIEGLVTNPRFGRAMTEAAQQAKE